MDLHGDLFTYYMQWLHAQELPSDTSIGLWTASPPRFTLHYRLHQDLANRVVALPDVKQVPTPGVLPLAVVVSKWQRRALIGLVWLGIGIRATFSMICPDRNSSILIRQFRVLEVVAFANNAPRMNPFSDYP